MLPWGCATKSRHSSAVFHTRLCMQANQEAQGLPRAGCWMWEGSADKFS